MWSLGPTVVTAMFFAVAIIGAFCGFMASAVTRRNKRRRIPSPRPTSPPARSRRWPAKVVASVVQVQTEAGNQVDEGSCIVLATDGLIMTNSHVVSASANAGASPGAARATVKLADGRTAPFTVNMNGQLIGMNSAIATLATSPGSIGLGFAIPVDQAKRIADQLIATGKAS